MPTLRQLVVELGVMLAVGVALAALGPYGSFGMGGFGTRLAYWLPAALGGWAIVRPIVFATDIAARRLALPQGAGLAAGVLLAALPMTPFILWLGGHDLYRLSVDNGLQLYLQIALIGGAVTLLFTLLERSRSRGEPALPTDSRLGGRLPPADPAPAPAAFADPPFLSRLPSHLRGDLIALEMEDHYVRAHAPGSSALVLLRMRDAVDELAGIDGLRVHRSWWVARDAVERVTPDGRSVRLTLRGGLVAPVARGNVPRLRAEGWLDPGQDARSA